MTFSMEVEPSVETEPLSFAAGAALSTASGAAEGAVEAAGAAALLPQPERAAASITASGKTYEGGWDNSIYAAAIGNASFNESYTSTETTADVSWGTVDGATDYRVYKYDPASKKWVLVKTVTGADTTSATVTGLTSGTTTKLKVNAYLTKGTKTYYGKAGTMLSVKPK